MELLAQRYIREHGLDSLCQKYAIVAKRHGEFGNLVFLKYDQIESPMGEPVVQECRGLILDEADDWRVVSFPFRKFFNHGEGHAPAIDWQTARVYEKLDGSLMTLYWYRGWRVASNGLPDASGPVYGYRGTFADLFWSVWGGFDYKMPCDTGSCYMFELMTPHNRVVVPHAKSRLVFLGSRELRGDFEEQGPDTARDGWESVRSFPLQTIADVVAASQAINPMESEGFVVRDARFNRVKVKSPQYVALAHMKDQFSPRRMLEVVRTNESDEFLSYFPEMREVYEDAKAKYESLVADAEADYQRLKDIPVQKDFALEAVKTRCSSVLFALRGNKTNSVREFLFSIPITTLERYLGIKSTVEAAAA